MHFGTFTFMYIKSELICLTPELRDTRTRKIPGLKRQIRKIKGTDEVWPLDMRTETVSSREMYNIIILC